MINVFYLAAVFGNRLITFLAVLALAYVLSPTDFGIYTLAFTNALVLQIVLSNWITNGAGRYMSVAAGGDHGPVSTVAGAVAAVFLLLSIATIVYAFVPFTSVPRNMVALVLCWSATLMLYELTSVMQSAQSQVAAFSTLSLIRNSAGAILSLAGAFLSGAEGAIVGQIIGAIAALLFIPSARDVWRHAHPRWAKRSLLRAIFSFGIVGTFASGLYMSVNFAIRNPVAVALGEDQAGLVALAGDLFFVPITLIINAFALTQMPELYRRIEAQAGPEVRAALLTDFVDQILLFTLPYLAGGALLAAPLVAFVLPGELGDNLAAIAAPAALFGAAMGLLNALTIPLLVFRHHLTLVLLALCTVIATLVSTLLLAPRGVPAVLGGATTVIALSALAAYAVLGIRGGAGILNGTRLRMIFAAAVMLTLVWAYRQINSAEPLSALLLGIAVYGAAVTYLGAFKLGDVLHSRTRPKDAAQAPNNLTD